MPVELLACPKCGGRGSEYEPNKWACLKCGQRFIYTPPSAAAPKVVYQPQPQFVERTVVREVFVEVPTLPPAPPLKQRGKLGRRTFALWVISIGCMVWGGNDRNLTWLAGVGALLFVAALLLTVFGLLRGIFRLLFGRR